MKIKVKKQIQIELDAETSAMLQSAVEKICDLQKELHNALCYEDRQNTDYLDFIELSQETCESVEKFLDCYNSKYDDED